ncbi:HAMP domain-containing sensor histidine kinase [Saccharomonospora sp. NPDC046836]|uniref:HAMP domain-containing sensor histidine kinase n=1 Tax=Saccharomonospora sp. NPDC046836 TaxID=3156921 RepID=UPI0033C3C21F
MSRRHRERRLLLRSRIALSTACIVAVVIAAISTVTWFATSHNLRTQLDETLRNSLPPEGAPPPPGPPGFAALCNPDDTNRKLQPFVVGMQLLTADGTACTPSGMDPVVTEPQDFTVETTALRDGTTRAGEPVRILLRNVGHGEVLMVSRSLTEIDDTLGGLRTVLIVVSVFGAVLAAASGLLLTRNALAPMERLTETAEVIARTDDLHRPITVTGHDEVGRLGRAFSAMTAALRESRRRQRALVSDAAHELRTPLTSLRTNIDLFVRSGQTGRPLPADQYAIILDRLQAQAGEFSELITELVLLARDEHDFERRDVEMSAIIDRALTRARSRAREQVFDVECRSWSVRGDAAALERSVLNLVDNAIKFAPAASTITVRSQPGWFTVTDDGPGVPRADRAQVFERFWRAPAARALPGSGLGLAIVADTIKAHGGTVRFTDPPSGRGASVRIDLPAT